MASLFFSKINSSFENLKCMKFKFDFDNGCFIVEDAMASKSYSDLDGWILVRFPDFFLLIFRSLDRFLFHCTGCPKQVVPCLCGYCGGAVD